MAYGITYVPCTSIKSQALADFVAKWTEPHIEPATTNLEYWNMYFDDSLMLQGVGVGAGVVLVSPSRDRMRYVVHLNFEGATNNIVEYEALLLVYRSHLWGQKTCHLRRL
jgi:hypothetical protein